MKKKIIFAFASPFLATALFLPSLNIPTINRIDNSAKVVETKNATKTFEKPKNYQELINSNIDDLITLKQYNSKDYGLTTNIKNQWSEGLCWAFSTASTTESSLLRKGLAPLNDDPFKRIDISEHNIDYGTNVRDPSEIDHLNLNPSDSYHKTLGVGGIVEQATTALSMWNAPIDSHTKGDYSSYVHPDFYLENSNRIGSVKESIAQYGQQETINRIKRLIATYGATTASYQCYGTMLYTNTNFKGSKDAGHAVSIIGWDDTIPKERYAYKDATIDGGWIAKNSWGEGGNPQDQYFYISYDSDIFDVNALDYVEADSIYQNNYYYDGNTTYGSGVGDESLPSYSGKKENGVIFPVRRANFNRQEKLEAVNVGIKGDDVKVTVSIYKNVKADFNNATSLLNDPTNGTFVTSVEQTFEYPGYKTIRLPNPVDLEFGTNFGITVKLQNKDNTAELLYATDKSDDNMTFYKDDNGQWVNPMLKSLHSSARIKAFTSEKEDPHAQMPNDLKYATVSLDKKIWKYGDDNRPTISNIKLGNKRVDSSEFELKYDPLNIALPSWGIGSVNDYIGYGTVTLEGKGIYKDTRISVPYKIQVGAAPDLQGFGTYDYSIYNEPRIINLNVNNNAHKYSDIILPQGFEWVGDDNIPLNGSGVSKLSLRYNASDCDYYYHHWWGNDKVRINVLNDNHLQPPKPTPLPEVSKPPVVSSPEQPQNQNNQMSVNLNVDNNYHEGDTINASASVYGVPESSVIFEWRLDGVPLNENRKYISFTAKKEHDGKQLQVIARCNGKTTNNSRVLKVDSSSDIINNQTNVIEDNKVLVTTLSSIIGVSIGASILSAIIVPILVIKKKKH